MSEGEESESFINLGVILNGKGEVLLIRRAKKEVGKGGVILGWAFPGGKQKYNESREDCVKREILVETGYDVQSTKQISLRMHPQFSILIVYHLCKLVSPKQIAKPSEPHEVAEIRWVKPPELKKLITTDLDPKVSWELGLN